MTRQETDYPPLSDVEQKRRKATLERAKATYLSGQLRLRLQYAKLKVDHGWQRQNLNEVENLYFRHSHMMKPKSELNVPPGHFDTTPSLQAASSSSHLTPTPRPDDPSKSTISTSPEIMFSRHVQSDPLQSIPAREQTSSHNMQNPLPVSHTSATTDVIMIDVTPRVDSQSSTEIATSASKSPAKKRAPRKPTSRARTMTSDGPSPSPFAVTSSTPPPSQPQRQRSPAPTPVSTHPSLSSTSYSHTALLSESTSYYRTPSIQDISNSGSKSNGAYQPATHSSSNSAFQLNAGLSTSLIRSCQCSFWDDSWKDELWCITCYSSYVE
ncbi:unnamed protein product [Somion occarium]|uniref:Uncharacterized protein n=1 Tax=Somion occarium TaxID=3059160 RepID=A0ABP1DRI6_9APHY